MATKQDIDFGVRMNIELITKKLNGSTDRKEIKKLFDTAIATSIYEDETKELERRRDLILTFKEQKLRCFYAYVQANKSDTFSMKELMVSSFQLMKNALYSDFCEVISAASGHELRYSPSFYYADLDKFTNDKGEVQEFLTAKECMEAYPDNSYSVHLEGEEGFWLERV